MARASRPREPRTGLYLHDPQAVEGPVAGGCADAETVEFGDAMLVRYYSSHEGTTNIYLAVVPLKK